jgi:hypothetical protein
MGDHQFQILATVCHSEFENCVQIPLLCSLGLTIIHFLMNTFAAPLKKSALCIFAILMLASFGTLQKASAQSSSVFDANYFNTEDGKEPPLRVGKGFDITDTYRQTRFCFTKETCEPASLTRQDNAQKTSITLHYTKSESEYQALKTNGKSGKVSFLNLFSIGGSTLEKYGYSTNEAKERLIFVAKVDFGKFEFGADPVLSPEAQALVDQKDFEKFISMYGTHYINGVRKEASVYVVLTRRDQTSFKYNGYSTSGGLGMPIPLKGTANYEVSDENAVNQSLSDSQFDLEIVVDGPSISTTDLQSSISKMLISKSDDMVAAIKGLISKTLGGISNHEEGKDIPILFRTIFALPSRGYCLEHKEGIAIGCPEPTRGACLQDQEQSDDLRSRRLFDKQSVRCEGDRRTRWGNGMDAALQDGL